MAQNVSHGLTAFFLMVFLVLLVPSKRIPDKPAGEYEKEPSKHELNYRAVLSGFFKRDRCNRDREKQEEQRKHDQAGSRLRGIPRLRP